MKEYEDMTTTRRGLYVPDDGGAYPGPDARNVSWWPELARGSGGQHVDNLD